MSYHQAKELLSKYKAGQCTDVEMALVEKWLFMFNNEDVDLSDERIEEISKEIWLNLPQPATVHRKVVLWPRIAAAASILLFLSVGAYFLLHKKQPALQVAQVHDIAPGGNKAILTLANGRKISVTDAAIGSLMQQAGSKIAKTADGQLVYTGVKANAKMVYDTLTIPRGGQYQLKLADGSKVWLNAATSIRYPESFTGTERKVELISGEAYFEVVHNARMPFRVVATGQTVEDIGTHFNISAYSDDPVIKTTLLEGSVRVSKINSNEQQLLKPGQQSAVSSSGNGIMVTEANTDEAVAWKNGDFSFNNEKIESIMRKLSRWYNIEIQYNGNITDEGFYGKISRSKNISEILKMLEQTKKIHFKIEGRRITVMQ